MFSLELGAAKAQLTRKEERYGITETIAKRLMKILFVTVQKWVLGVRVIVYYYCFFCAD